MTTPIVFLLIIGILLFIGLWRLADRNDKRPEEIKELLNRYNRTESEDFDITKHDNPEGDA